MDDFKMFLNHKQINIEENKERLLSFLLFEKFIRYIVGKQMTERKEINNTEQMIPAELKEKHMAKSIQRENEIERRK